MVSSKVRKPNQLSNSINSLPSHSSSISGNLPVDIPSPPIRLPTASTSTTETTYLEFDGSGSTIMTQTGTAMAGTLGSNSSIDTNETGFTQSPLMTPPKKTWERNYKSFLKRKGCQPGVSVSLTNGTATTLVPPASVARLPFSKNDSPKVQRKHIRVASLTAPPTRSFSDNATTEFLRDELLFIAEEDTALEDLRPSLADGFPPPKSSQLLLSSSAQKQSLTAPSSPTRSPFPAMSAKESASRGASLFKSVFRKGECESNGSNPNQRAKLRSKMKSVDSLDFTLRKGLDRKSPTGTPPPQHSCNSSPRTANIGSFYFN